MTAPMQRAFHFAPATAAAPVRTRQNIVIEAGAGTGKTTEIVAEVLRLLLEDEDLNPERIVLMTFTEKAAGEIADRIHLALTQLESRFDDDVVKWPLDSPKPLLVVPPDRKEAFRRACERQLGRIDAIRSQTIHSFCQSLLRMYPIEAGLDPQFRIIEGFERSLLYGQLYDAWLDDETRLKPAPETLREWEVLLAHVGYLFQIRTLVLALANRRDLLSETGYDLGSLALVEDDLLRALTDIRRHDLRCTIDEAARTIFDYVRETPLPERGSIETWIEYFAPIAGAVETANVPKEATLKEALYTLRTENAKGGSIHDRLVRHRSAVALLAMTHRYLAFIDREKRARGVVDFDDLLIRTLELLQNPAVAERVRQQFDFIFVDEFQDTDRIQARIIEKLATDRSGAWVPGKTVIVGDPKQSIYGFRRADPETYQSMAGRIIGSGGEHRIIRDHYRSDAPLLEAINAMFGRVFANAASNANVFRPPYHALLPAKQRMERELDARLTFLRAPDSDQPGVAEAEAVAEWIARHRGGARDLRRFAVLFRRLTRLEDYLDTFDRHGIDYVLPPTKAFLERRAPVDAVAVLRAIGFPFDLGAEISAARTPYFALTDDEIAEGIAGDGQAWRAYRETLESYRDAASHLTVAGLLDLLVTTAEIETIYAATTDGRRARRHLEHLRALAFDYDQKIGGSVRQFVDEIDRRRGEPDEMEPSLADDDSNAVRILSVHAAKGLEFETVILPDLTFPSKITGAANLFTVEEREKSLVMIGRAQSLSAHYRYTPAGTRVKSIAGERDEAETRRLFYVAVTRAKSDVVFVSGQFTKSDGFMKLLAETFGFDKNSYDSLWPATGREVRDGVAFERAAPHQSKLQTPKSGIGELAPLALPAITPRPSFTPAEAAMARARFRNKDAGILLHRFLERWDGAADPNELLRRLAGECAADEKTVSQVGRRIATLRRSPSFQRIFGSETLGRELAVRTAHDRRIDRLIRENGRELVVDYKSGSPDEQRLAVDCTQVEEYCGAIAGLTGRPCGGLLWYIDLETDQIIDVSRQPLAGA
jgi:ATP-dependent helicase/nuclease subunit A